MTHRGLFLCAESPCYLAPEIWRGEIGNKFGLCAKHALLAGWIDKMPEPAQESKPAINRKSFLTRLLDGLKNGNAADVLDELFPGATDINLPTHEPVRHWSEYREYPF